MIYGIFSEKRRFSVFFKNGGRPWVVLTHYIGPPDLGAHFIYTSQPRAKCQLRKPQRNGKNFGPFRPLLAILRHFLTSDVILKENFCRLASIWLIDLMKLFALGRIDSAVVRKLWLVGKVAKFTEMAIITLRILSSVGDA